MPKLNVRVTPFIKALTLLTTYLVVSGCSDKEASTTLETVSAGELIFNKNCKVCHAQGINGAPILGNQAMWKPRITQGEAVLIEHATNGFGLMPAKGGRSELPNSDVALAVKFMMSKVQ